MRAFYQGIESPDSVWTIYIPFFEIEAIK